VEQISSFITVLQVCHVEFDRKDINMNKLVATSLEGKFHVFDMRTQHPTKGFDSVSEKVIGRIRRRKKVSKVIFHPLVTVSQLWLRMGRENYFDFFHNWISVAAMFFLHAHVHEAACQRTHKDCGECGFLIVPP
jgi:hypothetical protein